VSLAIDSFGALGDIKPSASSAKSEKLARQRRVRDAKLGNSRSAKSSVAGTRVHATVALAQGSAKVVSLTTTTAPSSPSAPPPSAASVAAAVSASLPAPPDGRKRSSSISSRHRSSSFSKSDSAARVSVDGGVAASLASLPTAAAAAATSSTTTTTTTTNSLGVPALPAMNSQLSMKSSGKPVSKKALAVYAFSSDSNEHAVSFAKGEIITVLRELTNEWWLGRAANGAQGVFPASYVRVIVASNKARALFSFEARRERHLTFRKGDIITVFRKDKDWWDGMCNGRFGSFPGNHVRVLKDEEAARLESGEDSDDEARGAPPVVARMLSPRMIDQPAHGKKARLFHIKGKQQILVTKTVVSARSLNDGDVFVLDSGDGRVFLWNGTYARQVERTKGAYLATRLAEEESSELTVIEKGSEPAAFWEVLGGAEQVLSADEGGDDDEVSRTQMARRVLYRVVDAPAGPRLERVDVDTSVLTRTVLNAAHAYVLDINHEVFVWAGMEASGTHKFAGMQQAEDLIKDRAPHVDISWVLDGGELVFFREQFVDWQDDKQMRLAEQMQTQQQMTYALQLEAGVGAQPAPSAPLDPLKLAVVKFNSKPKDGVKYMIKQKLCRKTAKDVARLLWQLPQINMAQLGDYLSEKSEFSQAVLLEFVRHIDLRGRSFDSGLREFLQHFRLPGEAQKIDRIMERFAAQLVEQNPSLGLSPDTCFVLAFATIMLNTDAHNSAIKNKMTRDEFVVNTMRLSKEIRAEFCVELYNNITGNEIKMDVDAFGDQEKSGFLAKRQLAGWKRKWFVLSNNNLYYFNDKDDKNPRFILPLEALQVRKASQLGQKWCFEIFDANARLLKCCKLSSDGVLIEAKQKTLILAAETEAQRDEWLAAVGQNVLANPFYEFLKRRLGDGKTEAASSVATASHHATAAGDSDSE
jgi:hypothetical protein